VKPRRIDVHIDHLVVDGGLGDPHRLGAALEAELAELISQRGLPATAPERPTVDGGAVAHAPGAPPERLGAQVARGLYRSLGR
jgi:hypothetical protein